MNAKPYSAAEVSERLSRCRSDGHEPLTYAALFPRLLATAERAELLDEAGELLERISTAAADGEFAEANMLAPKCRAFLARVKR